MSSKVNNYHREELGRLIRKSVSGAKSCVPVFGAGVNLQAAAMEGYRHRDDWAELLNKIALRIGLSSQALNDLPRTHLALWEAMLRGWAKQVGVYPYKAEGQLQRFVCDVLKKQEEECRTFRLYSEIATAGFENIISLNFDRRIARSCRSHKFNAGPVPCPQGSHGESLFRHSWIRHSDGRETRIWYPHGDVKKAETIKLGIRKYGFYIGIFREYLNRLGDSWRYKPNSRQLESLKSNSKSRSGCDTWLDLILRRPLVFIGCGLSSDEWPLWWLLRQRGFAHQDSRPTYVMSIQRDDCAPPAHFQLLPNIRVVSFTSPQELWDSFLGWIAPKG